MSASAETAAAELRLEADEPKSLGSQRSVHDVALKGSLVEVIGYGIDQVLRLITNLVLSRLLFPEAYGLTTIVTVFLVALGMLSDVGIRESIIRSPRGDEPRFLNTAWSIQIIRGGLVTAAVLIGAYPISVVYGQPLLLPMLLVSSLQVAIWGFESTALATLARHVNRVPLVLLEIVRKLVSMLVMFLWAWHSPSVWALVAGSIVGTALMVVGSHMLPVHYKNRPAWDASSARELKSFGKWVFGSSAFTFGASEGDRLLLGYFLGMSMLGVYSMAGLLSSAIGMLANRVTTSVVYGVFGMVAREAPAELGRRYYEARLRLDLVIMPVLGACAALGPTVVRVLYDARYAEAGWMLRILCVRTAFSVVNAISSTCLMARNDPEHMFYGNVARFVALWIGIPAAWYWYGLTGAIVAAAASELAMLPVMWFALRQHGILRLGRETLAPAALLAGAALGWALDASLFSWLAHALQVDRW